MHIHTHMQTHTHTCTCTHTHTYIHTCTHMHTHSAMFKPLLKNIVAISAISNLTVISNRSTG